jgi:hypothetical protein
MRAAIGSSADGDVILITANLTLTTIDPGTGGAYPGIAHFRVYDGKSITIRGDCPENTACITLDANNADGSSPRTKIFTMVNKGFLTTVENLRFINVRRHSLGQHPTSWSTKLCRREARSNCVRCDGKTR